MKINILGEKKGITLISLVITILVLFILAGVTIGTFLMDEGLIGKSRESANAYGNAAKEEVEELEDKKKLLQNELESYNKPETPGIPIVEKGVATGDYISYQSRGVGDTGLWLIFDDEVMLENVRHMEIIPVTLSNSLAIRGLEGDLESSVISKTGEEYNNGYEDMVGYLNTNCEPYIVGEFAIRARSLGSLQSDPTSNNTTPVSSWEDVSSNEENYREDVDRYENIPINPTLEGNSSLWLATREASKGSDASLYATKYYMSSVGYVFDSSLYRWYSDRGPTIYSSEKILAPIITLKSGVKITSGTGTEADPYI